MNARFGLILCLLFSSALSYAATVDRSACARAHAVVAKSKSPSLGELAASEKACNAAYQPTCERETAKVPALSQSDFDLVLMTCALRASYAANLAAGKGTASAECTEAFTHSSTMSSGIAQSAASECLESTNGVCGSLASDLDKALCRERAAFAGYSVILNDKKLKISPEMEKKIDAASKKELADFLDALKGPPSDQQPTIETIPTPVLPIDRGSDGAR